MAGKPSTLLAMAAATVAAPATCTASRRVRSESWEVVFLGMALSRVYRTGNCGRNRGRSRLCHLLGLHFHAFPRRPFRARQNQHGREKIPEHQNRRVFERSILEV